MKIELLPTAKLRVNPDNPRVIRDERFAKLVQSIREFPKMLEIRPIVVNAEMMVLGGNMRLRACQEAGLKKVPVIRADELTEDEQRRFIIADNVAFGEHDWEILSGWEVEELTEWGLGIPDFSTKKEVVEDDYEVPEVIETDIVLGDLFEIGRHRLLCGDSTVAENVERLMGGEKADMVFTDPPYGVGYDGTERWAGVKKQKSSKKRNEAKMIVGDDKDFDPSFLLVWFSYCAEVFIWGLQHYPDKLGKGGVIVWNRKTMEQQTVPHADFELCWSKQPRNKMAWIMWGGYHSKESGEKRLHTTQKPIALPVWFFERWGKPGDLVIDLFLGSGTTMVAGDQMERTVYAMEISPQCCQITIDRMLNLDPTLEIKRNGQPYQKQPVDTE